MAETQGPADQKAGARAKSYAVLSGLLGLIPVLTVFKIITTDQGVAIGQFVQSGIGLAGAFGLAFASAKVSQQKANGTFDPAPQAPPALTAVDSIKAIGDQFTDLTSTVAAGLDLVGRTAAAVPGLGPLVGTGAALGGSLVDQVMAAVSHRDAAVAAATRQQQPPA